MALDFGMVYELSIDEPVTSAKEQALFASLVPQVKTADRVGFRSVWHVEHHFLKGFSHSSANDVILGAYAAATERIEIGFGVKLLPFAFNHPVKAAEAVATLDLMSGGRANFGSGRGISRAELEGFGVDPRNTRAEWRESLEMIIKCWEDGPFSWDSPSFKIPERDVVPKPVQTPHPPLWMAATSAESHEVAGELGMGVLSFVVMVPLDEVARRITLHREAQARCTSPIGKAVNPQSAIFTTIYCGETDEEARETAGAAMAAYIRRGIQHIAALAQWVEGSGIPSLEYLKQMLSFDISDVTFENLDAQDLVVIGSPDTCIEKIKRYQDTGATQVLGNFQGPGIPNEAVRRSIERFGTEVIPAFQ